MKYYNLHISFEPSWETFNIISKIMGVEPLPHKKCWIEKSEQPSDWTWQLVENEDENESIDFVNIFLDKIEAKFDKLKDIGIGKKDLLIWVNYEYHKQCAMEFSANELERIGKNGINLNIDCFEIRGNDE